MGDVCHFSFVLRQSTYAYSNKKKKYVLNCSFKENVEHTFIYIHLLQYAVGLQYQNT